MQKTLDVKHTADLLQSDDQYSLGKILGLWALVVVPMSLLVWVVTPIIIPYSPFHPGVTFWLMVILGMAWEFVVSVWALAQEGNGFSWAHLKTRLWLQAPQNPRTGERRLQLLWWIIPALVLAGLLTFVGEGLDTVWGWLLPFLAPLDYMNIETLATPEFQGAWWLLGIAVLNCVFNYALGEELFFHGVLLPKMRGVFGRWDWVANGALFGLYHLHKPWMIPGIMVSCMGFALPARYFRSNWFPIVMHGIEGVILLVIVTAVILGMAG